MPVDQWLSDSELIERIQNGEISAFEQLIERYNRPVHAFIHRYIRDSQDVDDIAQDTFISIYRSIGRIDTTRKFSSYLFTAAKNMAYSFLRKYKVQVTLDEENEIATDEDLYELLSRSAEEKAVQTALSKIEKKYAAVLTLYYFDGLSYEEIGKTLHIPINTIRTHLSRAKDAFRRIYEDA
jgi:RNA polymerase sigma-70 factor (ECF subfamily)